MEELFYTAADLAVIVSNMGLPIRQESEVFRRIWKEEREFLPAQYRNDYRRYSLDTRYWCRYYLEKDTVDQELPVVYRDLLSVDHHAEENVFSCDFAHMDLLFKRFRLTIMYGRGKDYKRMKLRTLLRQYGYKKRSQKLLKHIHRCMDFYHLAVTLKGNRPCKIERVALDEMLIFHVVKEKQGI